MNVIKIFIIFMCQILRRHGEYKIAMEMYISHSYSNNINKSM